MRISSVSSHHPAHKRRRSLRLPFGTQHFLAVIEGLEGGFAISASIITGLHFSNMSHHILIMTVIVSILVNGFNAASVKYSSEHYLDELDGREKKNRFYHYWMPALIEFFIYLTISLFAIIPLLIIPNTTIAVIVLSIITLVILFAAGWWRGYTVRLHPWKDATETCLLGAAIITVGALTGWLVYTI